MILNLLTAASLVVAVQPVPVPEMPTTFTGCLKHDTGVMYYIRPGSVPMHPCDAGDNVISFNQTGPQGPPGPPGPAAPAPPHYRFVGITTQVFQGNGGRNAMNGAC